MFESERIDSLRGVACALLVAFHLTGQFTDYRQIEAPLAIQINEGLSHFRMPAFIFLSGLILGITNSKIASLSFVSSKAERLIIPFLFVTVLLTFLRGVVWGDIEVYDVLYFWIYPYYHMWFLPAVFLFFLTSAVFSRFVDLRSTKGAAIFLFTAFTISLMPLAPELPLTFIKGTILFPYFAVGLLVANMKRGVDGISLYAIVAIASGLVTVIRLVLGTDDPWRDILQCAVVLTGFSIMPRVNILAYLGRYSFSVYLFHTTVISIGIRFMLGPPLIAAVVIFLGAILLPILMEICLRRYLPVVLPLIGQQGARREIKKPPSTDDLSVRPT